MALNCPSQNVKTCAENSIFKIAFFSHFQTRLMLSAALCVDICTHETHIAQFFNKFFCFILFSAVCV